MKKKTKKKSSNKNNTLKLKELSKNKSSKKRKVTKDNLSKIEDKSLSSQKEFKNKKTTKVIDEKESITSKNNISKIEDKSLSNPKEVLDKKTTKKNDEKKFNLKIIKNKKIVIPVSIVSVLLITLALLFIIPVKRNVYVELGTKKITDKIFIRKIPSFNKILTDVSKIDLTKVKNHKIKIKLNGLILNSTLHIVDTTAPQVKFQDVYQYKDYKINALDFIKSKQDLSKMKVYIENKPTIKEFKNYKVMVVVKDEYGNTTKKEKTLHIEPVRSYLELELGSEFDIKNILYSDIDKVEYDLKEIEKIDTSKIGNYTLNVKSNGKKYKTKIKVQDTTPPTLELQDKSIFWDEENIDKEDFIKEVSDASLEVETTIKEDIKYGKLGDYKIEITATDKYGLKTTKEATLSIIKDTTPPSFKGIGAKTVYVGSSINYKNGVTAIDNKDGNVGFSVDSSKVNTSKVGTYYATYKAIDKSGNKKEATRKIIVKEEVKRASYSKGASKSEIVKSVASKIGNSIKSIHTWVYNNISYHSEWGGSDPVKYGLTKYRGNCYVHAMVFNALLEAKGYEAEVIWTTDKTHYWNIIKTNGKWLHYDTSAGYHVVFGWNNKQRKAALNGRNWDHSKWPVG